MNNNNRLNKPQLNVRAISKQLKAIRKHPKELKEKLSNLDAGSYKIISSLLGIPENTIRSYSCNKDSTRYREPSDHILLLCGLLINYIEREID